VRMAKPMSLLMPLMIPETPLTILSDYQFIG
jgi:hypothetical protein